MHDNAIFAMIPILGISCGLIAIIGGVFFRPWFAYRQRRMELEASMVAEKAAQYAAQTERLEQRVRVLERIATDKGADLADEAGAKQLCLFHHDPSHDDEFMDSLAAAANDARPGTITAREGQIIDL